MSPIAEITNQTLVAIQAVGGPWLPQTQTWLYNQIRFLPQEIESHIVCDRTENLDQFPAKMIHASADQNLLSQHWENALRTLRLRRHRHLMTRIAQKHNASIVHSHFGPEGWRNLRALRKLGARHVVTFYGYDVNCLPRSKPQWRMKYARLFDEVDTVLCEGEHMRDKIIELGCPPPKTQIHRLGIDLNAIPYLPRQWDGCEPLRVLLAATFREKKGLPYAINALGLLRRDVDLRVTIIGDATATHASQMEKEQILNAIKTNGLEQHVTLSGFQPHSVLLEQARKHHLFLSPSVTASDGDSEGGAPVTIIEMAASGLPVVSTHHCDIPGVIRHGETGFLAAERDVDDLRCQLQTMIECAHDWPQMLHRGRRWIEERFDARRQGKQLAALYTALVEGRELCAMHQSSSIVRESRRAA